MQYMLVIYNDQTALAEASADEVRAHVAAFAAFTKELIDRGIFQGGSPLRPVASATTVRVRDNETLVTDGPYVETKEQLAGYFVVDCIDLDDAIAVAAKVPSALTGAIEVRPVDEDLVRATLEALA
jgi:hypothetical protein